MPHLVVAMIMIIYRGQSQQFNTATHAMQFLQGKTITTNWLYKITADIHLVAHDGGCQARYLRGQKGDILAALQHLEREITQPHP